MRVSAIAPALLACVLPLVACSSTTPAATDPTTNNAYAQQGQYGQTGQYGTQTGQYGTQTGQYGTQTGQYGTQPTPAATGQYTAPTGQYQQTAPAATGQAAPAATGGFQDILKSIPGLGGQATTAQSSGGSATPIAFASVLTPAIQMLASSEAPGMSAEGQAFAGQFTEGQSLEQPLTIQAGKCYTVVAASAGTIQQLDVQLVLQQSPMPAMVLAQGTGTSTATLGGKSAGCFRNSLPVGGPGKVIVKATRGAGIAGAQIFSK
jgi:hypothetical protein